jgi:hypothetical protein
MLTLIGFGCWGAALVTFIVKGVDKRLRLRPRWATLCGGLFVIGFTLFLIGLKRG